MNRREDEQNADSDSEEDPNERWDRVIEEGGIVFVLLLSRLFKCFWCRPGNVGGGVGNLARSIRWLAANDVEKTILAIYSVPRRATTEVREMRCDGFEFCSIRGLEYSIDGFRIQRYELAGRGPMLRRLEV